MPTEILRSLSLLVLTVHWSNTNNRKILIRCSRCPVNSLKDVSFIMEVQGENAFRCDTVSNHWAKLARHALCIQFNDTFSWLQLTAAFYTRVSLWKTALCVWVCVHACLCNTSRDERRLRSSNLLQVGGKAQCVHVCACPLSAMITATTR